MASTSAEELAEALVELAETLSGEFDLDDFLRRLANRCVRLLDVAAACLFLIDHGTAGSHPEAVRVSESGEGPGVAAGDKGEVVAVPDLVVETSRWPVFATAALAAGYAAAHAVPLRRKNEVIGSLTLFRASPGAIPKADVRIAQAIADLAAVGLLQARALRKQTELAVQLQHALNSRVIIEQAKGVLAERLGVTMTVAFTALRTYARSHNTRVSDLALSIVDGEFDTSRLRR